jgi:hypothetical protein
MEEKLKKEVKVKPKKEIKIKSNRVYGKDWIFSGQSKNFPRLLDIRYEKDLKLQESSRKKKMKKIGIMPKTLFRKTVSLRKPEMLD